MPDMDALAIAKSLNLQVSSSEPVEIRSAILNEMQAEQPLAGKPGSERYRDLVTALGQLDDLGQGFGLARIPTNDLVEMSRSLGNAHETIALLAAQNREHQARTEDREALRVAFRHRVTIPAGAFGTFFTFVWANSEQFFGLFGSQELGNILFAGVIGATAIGWLAARRQSDVTVAISDRLHEREIQDEALRRLVFGVGNTTFTVDDYAETLGQAAGAPRGRSRMPVMMGSHLSRSIIYRASNAALARMVGSGWIAESVNSELVRRFSFVRGEEHLYEGDG